MDRKEKSSLLLHAVETPTSKAGNKNLGGLKVGVVIPTLDEEKNIGSVVRRLKALSFHDVLVVDGNSRDRTRQVARDCGARVIVQGKVRRVHRRRRRFCLGLDIWTCKQLSSKKSWSTRKLVRKSSDNTDRRKKLPFQDRNPKFSQRTENHREIA